MFKIRRIYYGILPADRTVIAGAQEIFRQRCR